MTTLLLNQTLLLKDHTGPVNVVRYNNDGQYCMTGGHDKTVKLWNPNTGKLIKIYTGHGWEVLSLCISKDNTSFASSGGDKLVFLWDVAAGKCFRKFQGHFQRVNCVAFNDDASVLASGSYDATVRLWDTRSNTRTPIQTLEEHKDSISSVSMNLHEIVTGCVDGCVRIYDLRMGMLHQDQLSHPVTSVQVSNDGNCTLVSSLDNTVRLFDKENGSLLNHFVGHKNSKYKVESCLSSSNAHVLSGSEDGKVVVWDLVEGKMVNELQGHHRTVMSLSYHPEQDRLLSASSDGTVICWAMK